MGYEGRGGWEESLGDVGGPWVVTEGRDPKDSASLPGSPPLPPNALGVSSPGETCRKGVKTGKLFYWEKQRKERKVTLKGYRRKRLSASN